MSRSAGLRAAKLAGGRRRGWLSSAGCCARGSRPGRRPGRPAPNPPPTAGGCGSRLASRPPLRLRSPRSWGGSAGLGHSSRLRSAIGSGSSVSPAELQGPGRQPLLPEHGSWSPGTRGRKGEAGGARRPLGFTRSSLAELARPLSPSPPRCRGGGCRSCHSSSRPRARTAELSRAGFFPGGTGTEAAPRSAPSPSPENNYSGFALATRWGGASRELGGMIAKSWLNTRLNTWLRWAPLTGYTLWGAWRGC